MRSLVVLCALCHVAYAQSWTVGEGVVAAPGDNTAYVMEPKALVAIDIAKGRVRWSNKTMVKPLATIGDALLALDGKGALRVLETKTGKPRKGCDTIPNVTLQLQDGLGSNQSSYGISDGKKAWIAWTANTHYAGGAAPTPEMEKSASTHREGVWEVDVASCSAKTSQLPRPVPQGAAGVTPGGITVTFEPGKAVHRTRGADKLPDIAVAQTSMLGISADHQIVFVAMQRTEGYDVTMIDLDTTKPLGTIAMPFLPYGALLVNGKLVASAVAFDTVKLKELWRRNVRSLRYEGPYPP